MALPDVLSRPLALPVVAAPMFISSVPDLVIAECQAGVVGSFPALNARPSSLLADWLDRIVEENGPTRERIPMRPSRHLQSTKSCTAPVLFDDAVQPVRQQ